MPHRIKTAARRLTERVLAPHFAEQTAELTRQMQLSFATGHLAEIPLVDSTSQLPVELTEFNHLLHALRTVELSRMPRAAKVLLSVGCSDRSYFDWIEQAHGRVEQHWGVELFRPEPDDLPSNARWIVASASAMPQVSDDSVDVIFSGQNFEHLPVADLVGFLVESHRVLMPGGTLVIDSPNRLITEPIAWRHPEHVIEVSPDEAKEILTLAGFDTVACRGIWLCRDDDSTILPLMPPGNDVDELLRRSVCAGDAPDRSFCWWLEAEASSRIVDRNELTQHISSVFDRLWTMRVNRGAFTPGVTTQVGTSVDAGTLGSIYRAGPIPLFAGGVRVSVRGANLDGVNLRVTDEYGAILAEGHSELTFDVSSTMFGVWVDVRAEKILEAPVNIIAVDVSTSAR